MSLVGFKKVVGAGGGSIASTIEAPIIVEVMDWEIHGDYFDLPTVVRRGFLAKDNTQQQRLAVVFNDMVSKEENACVVRKLYHDINFNK